MSLKSKHAAFTMIELIFVIVIMGIIGKFGVEFLANAYENFIFSKINNHLQSTSGAAVELIAKRLEFRIKKSAISRNTTTGTWSYIQGAGGDDNATVLEWISTDIDGFRGNSLPFWSAVIDLGASSETKLISPATNTTKVSQLINTLSYGNSDINDTAIYFINSLLKLNPWGYDGVISDQSHTMHPIKAGTQINEILPNSTVNSTVSFTGNEVYEYYKLAWTAYAIELKNDNLWLYYDYQPWQGEHYDTDGKQALIAEDISAFRFRSAGSLIKIQVCAKSNLPGKEYALCKEKTVY
ncbi:MAG: protein containing prepilin-type N- cleavage/methylation domain protein [Sulfurimonas sp.]|nr:MAG: protein containing prepilin-type N- cleavage/methylation domain protein [Sulfurimonas sp.]